MALTAETNTAVLNNTKTITDLASPASAASSSTTKSTRRSLGGLVKSGWSSMRRNKSYKDSKKRNTSSGDLSSDTPDTIEIEVSPTEEIPTLETTATMNPAEEVSTTETTAATATNEFNGNSLNLVVLLMHPVSHRFELVQLEFNDPRKAKVSDLLDQIPISVTEDCLKDQLFDSILDQDSTDPGALKITKSTKLLEAFAAGTSSEGKMVLVARPQGLSDLDALKMAKPIFTNKEILSMLELSGFNVSSWKKKKFNFHRPSSVTMDIKKDGSTTTTEEETDSDDDAPVVVQNSSTSYALLGLVVAMIVTHLLHSVMVRPVEPDFVLKPGSSVSKCGLDGYKSLFLCDDEYLKVGLDGTAKILDSDYQTIAVIKGSICGGDGKPAPEGCVDGLVLQSSDNTLVMGGKPVKQVLVAKSHKNRKLSPWPFTEEPDKLKIKVGSEKQLN